MKYTITLSDDETYLRVHAFDTRAGDLAGNFQRKQLKKLHKKERPGFWLMFGRYRI
jgi:hypothetical protein